MINLLSRVNSFILTTERAVNTVLSSLQIIVPWASRIDHKSDITCGCGARDHIVFSDDRPFVLQKMPVGPGLTQGRKPGIAVPARFIPVFFVPVGHQPGKLMADLRLNGKMKIDGLVKSRKITIAVITPISCINGPV